MGKSSKFLPGISTPSFLLPVNKFKGGISRYGRKIRNFSRFYSLAVLTVEHFCIKILWISKYIPKLFLAIVSKIMYYAEINL